MKVALIAFTDQGRQLGHRLAVELSKQNHQCDLAGLQEQRKESLDDWTRRVFGDCEALLFIAATGIAVRAIAPYLQSKATDPAVVVLDDRATWAIALVSGHLGGANALTRQVAAVSGAQAVITTATDVNGVFAVDVWAKSQNLLLSSLPKAKNVTAALLKGETVLFFSEYPWQGDLPKGLISLVTAQRGNEEQSLDDEEKPPHWLIYVSCREPDEQKIADLFKFNQSGKGITEMIAWAERVLWLIPRTVVLGIGCRKNTLQQEIEQAVANTIKQYGISKQSIKGVASIDLKKEEAGLVQFCAANHWPLTTYSAGQLQSVKGEFFSSAFVQQITGTDNVCERAAVLAADSTTVIIPKTIRKHVTVAAAERSWQLEFSRDGGK